MGTKGVPFGYLELGFFSLKRQGQHTHNKRYVGGLSMYFQLKIAIRGKTYKKGGGAKLQVIQQKLQVDLL